MGSVVAVITVLLLLLNGLDNPFHPGSAGSNRSRWSARCGSSTRRSAAIDDAGAAPVRRGRDADVVSDGRSGSTQLGGARRDRPARRSPPSRRRGAATRRPAGTASRRRRQPRANALRIESAKAAGLANTQTRDRRRDVHPVGQRLRPEADGARRLLLQALPRGVQARGRRVGRDQAAQEPERAADAVRDAAVQARGARRGRAARRGGGGVVRAGAPEHPARVELRARRRPLRRRPCSSPA